jgi:hypothetical protein
MTADRRNIEETGLHPIHSADPLHFSTAFEKKLAAEIESVVAGPRAAMPLRRGIGDLSVAQAQAPLESDTPDGVQCAVSCLLATAAADWRAPPSATRQQRRQKS